MFTCVHVTIVGGSFYWKRVQLQGIKHKIFLEKVIGLCFFNCIVLHPRLMSVQKLFDYMESSRKNRPERFSWLICVDLHLEVGLRRKLTRKQICWQKYRI